MQHKSCGDSVHWDFFSIFESAFENKTLCMESAIQDLQLTTSEKIQYVIDHFMEVCKVCLEPSENMTKLDDSEARLIQKINFLFYEEVNCLT